MTSQENRSADVDTSAPDRAALRAHLVTHRIAGDVATTRQNNLEKYARFVAGEPEARFGLRLRREWTEAEVIALMSRRCGVSPDTAYRHGPDRIDPDLTIDALDRYAARLARARERRERVMLATGHPATLLGFYLALAGLLRAAGCEIVEPAADSVYEVEEEGVTRRLDAVFVGGIGVVGEGTKLVHTHRSAAVELTLATLAAHGTPPPDLVIADHGWAGGAAAAGVDAIGLADSNDPALFAGEAEGVVRVTVPLDDGIASRHYGALVAYLRARAGL